MEWNQDKIQQLSNEKKDCYQIAEILFGSKPSENHVENVRKYMRRRGILIHSRIRRCYKGAGNPAWKGGQPKIVKGYRWIWNGTKYQAEHRYVAEMTLGRKLGLKEVVHHKDGNILNNTPENLAVFASNGEHLAATLSGKTPKWTKEGKKKINKGLQKAWISGKEWRENKGRHELSERGKNMNQFRKKNSKGQYQSGPIEEVHLPEPIHVASRNDVQGQH